jgi:hypothetical protein
MVVLRNLKVSAPQEDAEPPKGKQSDKEKRR